ncbi:Dihydroneopterin aldolase [Pseudoclavibacter triregionum]|nr:Dihydroneopterin aldolase [Pseudoclavibacter triregionum]
MIGLPEPELDRIGFRRLHVRAHHGVHDHEREQGQDFYVDCEVWADTRAAARSDDLEDTVHYGKLMRAIHASAAAEPVDLLETVAERLVAVCFGFRGVQAARVTIHKPQAPVPLDFGDLSVSILRRRDELESGSEPAAKAGEARP